jgi:hypothetical protein
VNWLSPGAQFSPKSPRHSRLQAASTPRAFRVLKGGSADDARTCASRRGAFTIRHVPILSPRIVLQVVLRGALLSNASAASQPQSSPPTPKIGTIQVSGQKKFSSEQVIAASGLKPGQEFSVKDLDAAAERLGKSGAFPDVSYKAAISRWSSRCRRPRNLASACLTISFG